MIVDEIIARLAAAADTPFAMVEGAAALSAITDAPEAMPAAYVFAKDEGAAPNERMTGPVLQRVAVDVAVVLVTENLSDPAGAAAATDVEALKAHVVAVLLGWRPASAAKHIELVGGEMKQLRGGVVWWEMTFTTEYFVRQA